MKNTLMLKRIAAITLVLFSFTFGASLWVTVNTVKASDNVIKIIPYTRYYTCGSPGTNSYGIVHTETGDEKHTYYFADENPNHMTPTDPDDPDQDEHYGHYGPLYWVIPPHIPGAYWIREHIDHPVTTYTFLPYTEYIHLDRDHWRCR